jgi:hypothetical protein
MGQPVATAGEGLVGSGVGMGPGVSIGIKKRPKISPQAYNLIVRHRIRHRTISEIQLFIALDSENLRNPPGPRPNDFQQAILSAGNCPAKIEATPGVVHILPRERNNHELSGRWLSL